MQKTIEYNGNVDTNADFVDNVDVVNMMLTIDFVNIR